MLDTRRTSPREKVPATHVGWLPPATTWCTALYLYPCLCMLVLIAPSIPASAQISASFNDPSHLVEQVERLNQQVAELAGSDDLLDTLYYGWFDRPYARATLAVLVKTAAVLRREVRLRELGNGVIQDARVQDMLTWADDAVQRVRTSTPTPGFRPHRRQLTADDLSAESSTPTLFGFVDRSSMTRQNQRFGDLDLMAAMGFRVYGLHLVGSAGSTQSSEDPVLFRRAEALGMAVVGVERPIKSPLGSESPPANAASPFETVVRPVALRQLMQMRVGQTGSPGVRLAIVERIFGESHAGSVARHALARGVLGDAHFVVDGWHEPTSHTGSGRGPSTELAAAWTRAAIWASVLDGQSLGLLRGWRDLRDGSASMYSSVHLDPARVETIAHTALDLIRLESPVARFSDSPPLAIAVAPDAISDRDENRWAAWAEVVWTALTDHQIHFDLVSQVVAETPARDRYEVVFPLRRDEAGDMSSVLLRLDRACSQVKAFSRRVTAREIDGAPASDVLVREAGTPDGERYVAIVNLTPIARRLKLRGASVPAAMIDIHSETRVYHPADGLNLDPYQVRLLMPIR